MKLKYEAKNAWEFERANNNLDDVMNYSKEYMKFLDVGKTDISTPISPITDIAEKVEIPGTVQSRSISETYFSDVDRIMD